MNAELQVRRWPLSRRTPSSSSADRRSISRRRTRRRRTCSSVTWLAPCPSPRVDHRRPSTRRINHRGHPRLVVAPIRTSSVRRRSASAHPAPIACGGNHADERVATTQGHCDSHRASLSFLITACDAFACTSLLALLRIVRLPRILTAPASAPGGGSASSSTHPHRRRHAVAQQLLGDRLRMLSISIASANPGITSIRIGAWQRRRAVVEQFSERPERVGHLQQRVALVAQHARGHLDRQRNADAGQHQQHVEQEARR